MKQNSFWPLDYDPEGEVYENLAWDLPGYRRRERFVGRNTVAKIPAKPREAR